MILINATVECDRCHRQVPVLVGVSGGRVESPRGGNVSGWRLSNGEPWLYRSDDICPRCLSDVEAEFRKAVAP